MQVLYTEEKFSELKKQIGKRERLLFVSSFLFLAVIAAVLLTDNHKENRPELVTTLLVIFGGGLIVFFWDLTIHPLRSYAKHIDSALYGRSHEIVAVFSHIGQEDSVIDGLTFRDLIFLGEADKHGDRERMLYWDTELPLPSFIPGQEIRLRYYDRFLTGYEVL